MRRLRRSSWKTRKKEDENRPKWKRMAPRRRRRRRGELMGLSSARARVRVVGKKLHLFHRGNSHRLVIYGTGRCEYEGSLEKKIEKQTHRAEQIE